MSVICQCPSCKAKYQVDDKYAGRAIKCPNCSSAVGVPAVARVARPAVVASDHPPSAGISKVAPAISSKVELPEARVVRPVKDRPVEPPKIAAEKIPSASRERGGRRRPSEHRRTSAGATSGACGTLVGRGRPSRPSSAAADAVVVWPAAADQETRRSAAIRRRAAPACRRTGGPAGRGAARAAAATTPGFVSGHRGRAGRPPSGRRDFRSRTPRPAGPR